MPLLSTISGPRDLDRLSLSELDTLAAEIRAFLVENVARSGGHLGPNLGVVELTIAIHRVFRSPEDPIIFDTGHQSYVHKLLTGRQDFSQLRSRGGLAGYPQRSESAHDVVESSHASSSLSWADGVSRALTRTGHARPPRRRGRRRRRAHRRDDVGGAQQHLRRQRPQPRDRRQRQRPLLRARPSAAWPAISTACARRTTYRTLHRGSRTRSSGASARSARAVYRGVRGGTHGFLSRFTNNAALYSNLDIKYLGPVDGHDLESLIETLELAKSYGAPVIVHAITEKGRGYPPGAQRRGGPVPRRREASTPSPVPLSAVGTGRLDRRLLRRARDRGGGARGRHRDDGRHAPPHRAPAVRTALPRPRLRRRDRRAARRRVRRGSRLRRTAPRRRHLRDVHEPRLRSGRSWMSRCTAPASPSCSIAPASPARTVPATTASGTWRCCSSSRTSASRRRATPRDCARSLHEALAVDDAPTVVRFPKGTVSEDLPAIERLADGVDVLARSDAEDVLLVGIGPMAHLARRCRGPPARAGDRGDRGRPALGRPRPAVPRRPRRPAPPRDHDRRRHPRRGSGHAHPSGAPRSGRRHRRGRAGPAGRVHRPRQPRADPRRCGPHPPRRSRRTSSRRCWAPASPSPVRTRVSPGGSPRSTRTPRDQ